jgi:hypothetical protein
VVIGCGSLNAGVPVTGWLLGLVRGFVGLNLGVVIAVGSKGSPKPHTPAFITAIRSLLSYGALPVPVRLMFGAVPDSPKQLVNVKPKVKELG